MVAALEKVAQIEDRAAVAGFMALLFGDFPLAQNLLLTSPSHAVAALEMRKDLLQVRLEAMRINCPSLIRSPCANVLRAYCSGIRH